MDIINQYHETVCTLIARIFLGVLFFLQGYDAVVNIKMKNVIRTYQKTFAASGIPHSVLAITAWFTSGTALIGGALLLLGLCKYLVLYLLGINLVIAAIGFGINTPMWDIRHVLPRLILLLLLLALPQSWDTWSIDSLLKI